MVGKIWVQHVVADIIAFAALILILGNCAMATERVLKMSTTTSTQSSGLLEILLPAFEADSGVSIKVVAKGTGAAIRDGEDGNVDIILVHAKSREEKFVESGYGTRRYPVMHNDFVIIGGAGDKAGVRAASSGAEALALIAEAREIFVSRGDDSGTHFKEQSLWKKSGVLLLQTLQVAVKKSAKRNVASVIPAGSEKWYMSIGQGMGKAITFTEEKQAYTLADRGTYIKYKYGKTPGVDLELLYEGGAELENPYGIIPVNPEKHSHVRYDLAMIFVEWLISDKGQDLIDAYQVAGQSLFFADAR